MTSSAAISLTVSSHFLSVSPPIWGSFLAYQAQIQKALSDGFLDDERREVTKPLNGGAIDFCWRTDDGPTLNTVLVAL